MDYGKREKNKIVLTPKKMTSPARENRSIEKKKKISPTTV